MAIDFGGIGTAVSGVSNAISGLSKLFGNDSDKDAMREANEMKLSMQREQNAREDWWLTNQIRERVKDAKAAGIHPLAAIGAGTIGNIGSAVPDFTGTASGSTALDGLATAGQGIGDAIKGFGSSERETLQNDLIRSQIRNTDASTAQTLAAATSRTLATNGVASTRGVDGETFTDVKMGGKQLRAWKGSSDAETASDRYGDTIEEIQGIANLFSDLVAQYLSPRPPGQTVPRDFQMPRGYHSRRRRERATRSDFFHGAP